MGRAVVDVPTQRLIDLHKAISELTEVLINTVRALKIKTTSFTWDPASLADGAGETKSVTVTGAALGDAVLVFPPYDLQDMVVSGYVQAADTVEVRLQNEGGATVDLASGTWKVAVIQAG